MRFWLLNLLGVVLLVGVAGASASSAFAQVDVQLNSASLTGLRGETLTYSGTLVNAGSSEIFMNSAGAQLLAPGLTVDLAPFTFGAPASLQSGEHWAGELFKVSIAANAEVPRNFFGTFTIEGGQDASAQNQVGSAGFSVGTKSASSAPEPSSLVLSAVVAVVLGAGSLIWRRYKKLSVKT